MIISEKFRFPSLIPLCCHRQIAAALALRQPNLHRNRAAVHPRRPILPAAGRRLKSFAHLYLLRLRHPATNRSLGRTQLRLYPSGSILRPTPCVVPTARSAAYRAPLTRQNLATTIQQPFHGDDFYPGSTRDKHIAFAPPEREVLRVPHLRTRQIAPKGESLSFS